MDESQAYWETIVRLTAELDDSRQPIFYNLGTPRRNTLLKECRILRDLSVCEVCQGGKPTVLHHRNYQCCGHEEANDMLYICRLCHSRIHSDSGKKYVSLECYKTLKQEVYNKTRPDLLKKAYELMMEKTFHDLADVCREASSVIGGDYGIDENKQSELVRALYHYSIMFREHSYL